MTTLRLAVTGASGFIGRAFCDTATKQGHKIRRIVHRRTDFVANAGPDGVLVADVTDPETLRGVFDQCDAVVHLAGCTIAKRSGDFERANLLGTENVTREIRRLDSPPKLVFVSSVAAKGPATRGGDPAMMPISQYGESKFAAEKCLANFASTVPIQIVRPPSVFGRDDPYMRDVFRAAALGWVVVPGRQIHRYSLVHIDDLVDAILFLIENPTATLAAASSSENFSPNQNGCFDIVHDPPVTFPEIAEIVASEVGRDRVRTLHLPRSICFAAARMNALAAKCLPIRPLVNPDKMAEALAGSWIGDSTNLCQNAGFRFAASLQERLRRTTRQYVDQGLIRLRSKTDSN